MILVEVATERHSMHSRREACVWWSEIFTRLFKTLPEKKMLNYCQGAKYNDLVSSHV